MNIVFMGSTRGMGRALARLMAERGDRLFLLGRHDVELERSGADLVARGRLAAKTLAGVARCDLGRPDTFGPALDAAMNALGCIDTVVVTAGLFATQDDLEADLELTGQVLNVNFTGTILFCEEARKRLLADGAGTLCVFSSVAGDRGRKPVILYGASKAGLSHYLEGLDHKYRAAGLTTVCVKPGFVKTGMTAGIKPPPFAGEPLPVAKRVLKAIDRGRPVVYAPAPWGPIMRIIRTLPRLVMRRISF